MLRRYHKKCLADRKLSEEETPGEACVCGVGGRLAEEGERPASEGRESG